MECKRLKDRLDAAEWLLKKTLMEQPPKPRKRRPKRKAQQVKSDIVASVLSGEDDAKS